MVPSALLTLAAPAAGLAGIRSVWCSAHVLSATVHMGTVTTV